MRNFKYAPKKSFGQHFLQNQSVLEQIFAVVNPVSTDLFVEIGPGFGILTKNLLPQVKRVDAIELDSDVVPELKAQCANLGTLQVYQTDVLDFDFNQLQNTGQKQHRLIGNLPYNISTPLLFHLLNFRHLFQDMHFMLQLEVAERLVAHTHSKCYSRLSVMMQYYYDIELLFSVAATAFYPMPEVTSAFVRFTPIQNPSQIVVNEALFSQIVKAAFVKRRKILSNSLRDFVTAEELKFLGFPVLIRPEEISVIDFVAITNFVHNK